MTKKIFGIIFIIIGINSFFPSGQQHPNIASGIVGLALGAYLLYSSRKNEKKQQDIPSVSEQIQEKPVKTFSFKAAGFRFECKFPSKGWQQTRQDILIRSKVGDAINLRQYEWEGEPAFALISDRWRADVGVVPAEHIKTVSMLCEEYTVVGKIISLSRIEYRKDFYTICDIQLSCYPKESLSKNTKFK